MTSAIFTPKAEKAQWEQVYDLLVLLPDDGVLTFEAATEALGWDLQKNRTPLYKAIRVFEENNHRTLWSVSGVGYRVAEPLEHETLGRKHHRKARRQLVQSRRKLASADRSKMTKDDADRLDRMELTVGRQTAAIARLEARQTRTESVVQKHRKETLEKVGDLDARMERMREALRRHNIDV